MGDSKTSLSNAQSYREIGDFWDHHDLGEFESQIKPAEFDVQVQSSRIFVPLEKTLAEKLRSAAEKNGVSAETLLNLWVQEKIAEESHQK